MTEHSQPCLLKLESDREQERGGLQNEADLGVNLFPFLSKPQCPNLPNGANNSKLSGLVGPNIGAATQRALRASNHIYCF